MTPCWLQLDSSMLFNFAIMQDVQTGRLSCIGSIRIDLQVTHVRQLWLSTGLPMLMCCIAND